jgi:hypothetical protein
MKFIEFIKGKIIYITVFYSVFFFLFSSDMFIDQSSDLSKYILPEYLIIVYFIWFIICLYFILFARLKDKIIFLGLFIVLYLMGFFLGYVPPERRGPGQMESILKVAFFDGSILSSGIWSIYYIVRQVISKGKQKQSV